MLRRCAGDYNNGKKGNQENDVEEVYGVRFSQRYKELLSRSGASGTCEDRSY